MPTGPRHAKIIIVTVAAAVITIFIENLQHASHCSKKLTWLNSLYLLSTPVRELLPSHLTN